MKVTTFAIKVWRWLSLVFLIAALFWTYSLFPQMVAVDFAETGLAAHYLDKEHVFYIVMGLFLLANVVIAGFARHVHKIDGALLPIPQKEAWLKNRTELNENISNWILCLVAVVNTIAGFSLFALSTVNSGNYKTSVFDFAWLYYAGFALIIFVFLLPLRLFWPPLPEDRL